MKVVNDGSDNKRANCPEDCRCKEEYAHGHSFESNINCCLNHSDSWRHPSLSKQVCQEEEGHAKVKVEREHETERVCHDA